jgi:two-component system KDP operon response regulator KdpE
VGAQLRRVAAAGDAAARPIRVGELEIDLGGRTLLRNGTPVHLTPIEWALLRAFVRGRGRTLTHHQLFRDVWGGSDGDAQAYLRVHIANLRRKIEPDAVRPRLLITVPGVGYRFEGDDG